MPVEKLDHYVAKFLVTRDEWNNRPLSERVTDRLIEILVEVRAIAHELATERVSIPPDFNEELNRIYDTADAARGRLERGEKPGFWIQNHLDEVVAATDSVMSRFHGRTEPPRPDATLARRIRHRMQTLAARFELNSRRVSRRLRRLLRERLGVR